MKNLIQDVVKQVIKLGVHSVAKQGGDDCLRALQTGLKAGKGNMTDNVARLLAGVDDALENGYKVAVDVSLNSCDDAARMIASSSDDAARMVATSGDNVMCAAAQAKKTPVPSVPTTTVKPPKPQSPIEKKIASIQERLKAPREAYQVENKAFRAMQQAHIDKFNAYVDDFANKYKDLVGKLDEATDPKEIANIKKQIAKLEAQAEKTMKQRLEKIGTLSPSEIQAKIKEAKNLAETRVANLTYATATSNGARAQAESFIKEVSQEFGTYNRELTPEQLKYMLDKRVAKLEQLANKAKLEDKTTLRRTINFGGMQVPVEIPVMGTAATDEIAQICGGKTPKEALEHYRNLQRKMNDAITKIKHADASDANGYVQFVEQPINIPIKDAPKSKELTWLEQQLKEKSEMLQAEVIHEGPKHNYIVAIG